MKWSPFLFALSGVFISVFHSAGLSQTAECRYAEDEIYETAESIQKAFKERDVSDGVEYIEYRIRSCNLDITQFGWKRGSLDHWRNTGYAAELEEIKRRIEHDSKYRDVSSELRRYREYASKLNLKSREVDSYDSKYRAQSLASVRAEEKTCQPAIDLRNETLGDVQDQDSIGWCYAFVGSDLLTYKLGKRVSAADLAMNYNDSWLKNIYKKVGWGEQDFQGAFVTGIGKAFSNTKAKGGACLEENLRSEDNGYSNLFSNLADIEDLKRSAAVPDAATCSSVIQQVFPNIQMKEIAEILDKSSRENLISMLSDKACQPRISMDNIEIEYTEPSFFGDTTEVFKQIDKQLENKNILSLAYNSELLYDRNAKGMSGHVSTIVGRRFNKKNGECEYLVRNTWGRGCSSYDFSYTCDEGNIWLPKSVISKGVINVGHIK